MWRSSEQHATRFLMVPFVFAEFVLRCALLIAFVCTIIGVYLTRWCISDIRQTCVWASLDDLLAVHGHGGKTELAWIDAENNRSGLAAYYGERLDAYRSVMERLQWCASGAHGRPMCPECCRRSDVGHRPDCGIAAVLGRPTVAEGHL